MSPALAAALAVLSIAAAAAAWTGARWLITPRLVARTRLRARLRPHGAHRPHIPAWIQLAVRARDRNRCTHCGMTDADHRAIYGQRLHLDHVKPRSRGGPDTVANLRLLCRPANLAKSNH